MADGRRKHHRWRRLGAGLAVAVVLAGLLAGCSLLTPQADLTIPATADARALPVALVDNAGIVASARPAPIPENSTVHGVGVRAVPGRDAAVLVDWMGGACDDLALVTIDEQGSGFRVSLDSRTSGSGCIALGVQRAIELTLSRPVGAGAFGG